jgi:hypothetical protein
MLTFDRKSLPIITLIIIGMTIILTAEESPAVRSTLPDGIFLTFNFNDHLFTVNEKRDQLIDNGQLSWYRYPGFSYTKPNYWYFVKGIKEPFAVHMSYVDYELSEIKLISSNNYENTEELRDEMKVTISRKNKGRGDCVIHYSINPIQMENVLDDLSGMEINVDEI